MKSTKLLLFLFALAAVPAAAQLPGNTPHGMSLKSTAASTGTPTTGTNFYQSSSATGPFTLLNAIPIPTAPGQTVSLFLAASGFTPGATYYFTSTDVAANGNESVSATVASAVATFPSNPGAPALVVQAQ